MNQGQKEMIRQLSLRYGVDNKQAEELFKTLQGLKE